MSFFSAPKTRLQSSIVWNGGITVPMIDINRSITTIIQLKDISIAVVPPPSAQLPVPATGQRVKEVWMLHTNHCEEVLVPQVAPEAILFCQFGHVVGLQQLVVESRSPHGAQVQKHHTAVEAWKALRRRFSYSGLRVLLTILPEGVSEGRSFRLEISQQNKQKMVGQVLKIQFISFNT